MRKLPFDKRRMLAAYSFDSVDFFNKKAANYMRYSSLPVFLTCDFCHKTFSIKTEFLWYRLSRLGKNFSDVVCQRPKCHLKQRGLVAGLMRLKGKAKQELFHSRIRGRSLEDRFGKEKADRIKGALCFARTRQTGEFEPHLGKKHGFAAREKMKASRHSLFQSDALRWRLASGELGTFLDYHKEIHSRPKSPETLKKMSLATLSWLKHGGHRNSCCTGRVKNIHSGIYEHYESSFEYASFLWLNHQGAYWAKNTKIILPYFHGGALKHYLPDICIYDSAGKLYGIAEVKPFEFAFPASVGSDYVVITREKFAALKDFCALNSIRCVFITELSFPDWLFPLLEKEWMDARKKKAVFALRQVRAGLLLDGKASRTRDSNDGDFWKELPR